MAANLKHMKDHVKAVQNIKKITQSMKVVAAAKFAKSEKTLRLGRPLGLGANSFYELSNLRREMIVGHIKIIAVTSDRGLCGSVHTKVCKRAKASIAGASEKTHDIVCVGEKAKSIFLFDEANSISLVVNGVGHKAPTFQDASLIVQFATSSNDFVQGNIFFPKFRNLISFDIDQLTIFSLPILLSSKSLLRYELESSDDLSSYLEFSQVSLMYYCLCETFLVELCSRMMAMTGASKNAGAMSDKLKIELNRKRQQLITNELIDIVSGAQVISSR